MGFILAKDKTFDIAQTLDCGQVFRFIKDERGFTVFSKDKKCKIIIQKDSYLFLTSEQEYFKKYFDFDTNYDIIQSKVQDKGLVSSAIAFGRGIHLLRQDAEEVIISFIISANNNISRIKTIIERMCERLGERKEDYYAFPTVHKIATCDPQLFCELGAGYRSRYIVETARELSQVNIESLHMLSTDDLRRFLMSLPGIGRKVADCALLFGFGRTEVFPTDTWIVKVFREEFGDMSAQSIAQKLSERYGSYSGYIQQWIFYHARLNKLRRHK